MNKNISHQNKGHPILYNSVNFYVIRITLRTKVIEIHNKFYVYIIKYVLWTHPPPKQKNPRQNYNNNKKHTTRPISYLIYSVHHLHQVPPHPWYLGFLGIFSSHYTMLTSTIFQIYTYVIYTITHMKEKNANSFSCRDYVSSF